jgi:transglutaminase-like putative cysteine protease
MRAPRWGAGAAALLLGLLTALPTATLGRPDWAIPHLSMPTPAGPYIAQTDHWVVVYEEVRFDLSPSGTITQRHRSIIENLQDQEATFLGSVEYNEGGEKLSDMSLAVQRSVLWHDIDLDEKSVQGGEAGSKRYLVTGAEKIPPHHRVVWEYTITDTLGFLPWDYLSIPEGLPVGTKRFEVTPEAAAKGLTLQLAVPGGANPPGPFTRGDGGSWTVTNVPAWSRIPSDLVYQPEISDLYPYGLVTKGTEDAASWAAFGEKYRTAWAENAAKVDQKALGEYAAGLCKGRDLPADKASVLGTFVQDKIEYDDSNERAMSGWLPLAPEESLRSMKADCKGKVMLFVGLLAAQGIEATPILLRSADQYFAWGPNIASARFNHVICAVNLPAAGTPFPSTLTEGPLKGWVLFDPTETGYRFGQALPGAEGLPAMAVAQGKTGAFTIRTAAPSIMRTRVEVRAELLSTDDLLADVAVTDNGGCYFMHRLLRSFSDDKLKSLITETLSSGTKGRITLTPSTLEKPSASASGQAELRTGFVLQQARQELTTSSLVKNPLAVPALVRGIPDGLPRREALSPQERIELAPPWDAKLNASGPSYELTAKVTLTVPNGWQLSPPSAREENRPWLKWSCAWKKVSEHTWEASLALAVPRGLWPPEERKARLLLVDELFRGLYAPLMLTKSG